VPHLLRLIDDPDIAIRVVAIDVAVTMPDDAFTALRPRLVELLKSDQLELRVASACAFSQRKDPISAPILLEFWKQDKPPIDENHGSRVSQAVYRLAGEGVSLSYQSHTWGPKNPQNAQSIARFEAWIARNPPAK
jgi:hypothetical protein